ncbi:MAG: glycosyltransferase [Candidatus Electrothrix sp. MAN1_4]|nr:glycosyltransferase [Candidatus Electrothrix sp. MAN1_4]
MTFHIKNRRSHLKIIEKYNLPVFLIDSVSENELTVFYMKSHLYISSSLYEGFGRTVIEAQLNGLPVIASNIPIYKEILRDSADYVDDLTCPKAWANSLKELIADKKKREKMVQLGKKNSERFLLYNIRKQFHNLIFDKKR